MFMGGMIKYLILNFDCYTSIKASIPGAGESALGTCSLIAKLENGNL
jgi:hypothetical protein